MAGRIHYTARNQITNKRLICHCRNPLPATELAQNPTNQGGPHPPKRRTQLRIRARGREGEVLKCSHDEVARQAEERGNHGQQEHARYIAPRLEGVGTGQEA